MWQNRITFNKDILVGKPIIKGTRISVDFILDLLANGWKNEDILENYPQITVEDIQSCIEYASNVIKDEKVILM
jgi:uncharacterized protein (DUF433 family)